MTMGEKLIQLRKRECWTQDDLAEKLDVSRQSVSKWEGDLAAPAIDKLLELSRLYGVSTDYLLKDELDLPGTEEEPAPEEPALRQVTLEEAQTFVTLKEASARPFALAVTLCILSPVCLILLGGLSAIRPVREQIAMAVGLAVLFAFVVPAVAVFVRWGMKLDKYEYLEKEVFTAAPGVEALARDGMDRDRETHSRRMVAGICLCVASAVPILVCVAAENEFLLTCGVGLLLAIVAAGAYLIVSVSIPWGAYQMLLQEGDYAPERKAPWRRAMTGGYWCLATAGYLAWSFITRRWDFTWIVWPVAAVLFAALACAVEMVGKRKK